jgi:hypothetical protein
MKYTLLIGLLFSAASFADMACMQGCITAFQTEHQACMQKSAQEQQACIQTAQTNVQACLKKCGATPEEIERLSKISVE